MYSQPCTWSQDYPHTVPIPIATCTGIMYTSMYVCVYSNRIHLTCRTVLGSRIIHVLFQYPSTLLELSLLVQGLSMYACMYSNHDHLSCWTVLGPRIIHVLFQYPSTLLEILLLVQRLSMYACMYSNRDHLSCWTVLDPMLFHLLFHRCPQVFLSLIEHVNMLLL